MSSSPYWLHTERLMLRRRGRRFDQDLHQALLICREGGAAGEREGQSERNGSKRVHRISIFRRAHRDS